MSMIQRIARRQVQRVTGQQIEHQPEALIGGIRPMLPGLSDNLLTEVLDARDRAPQLARIGQDYTHVSTITSGVCARQAVLANLYDKREWEPVTGGHRLMWKYGRAAEAHIRDQLTCLTVGESRQRFQVYGAWKCACERTTHVGTKPADMYCDTCRRPVKNYHETPFWHHGHKIVGNPDMSLILNRYMIVVEIKSMTAEQWKALTAPLPEHVNQALIYRDLHQEAGFLAHNKVIIIYACKEFRWGSPYKEFHVDVTTAPYQRVLALSYEVADQIRDGIAGGLDDLRLPPRLGVCRTSDDKRPKGCAACATCFNLQG